MKEHKLNNLASLQFIPVNGLFFPKVIQGDNDITVPLLVSDDEIETIINRISPIDFNDLPANLIAKIIAGCISTVLKYCHNN